MLCVTRDLVVWCYFWELFFVFKQKTAYEMRISDWSSVVCSSDLFADGGTPCRAGGDTFLPSRRPCNRQNNGRERHARQHVSTGWPSQIGRASGRERVCQYV